MKSSKIAVFLAVIASSWWLIGSNDTTPAPQDLSERPQFYMENFQQLLADEQGVIHSRLTGESLDLFTKKDYAIIKNPKLTTNLHTPNSWKLNAAHAQGFHDKIFLSGQVHAQDTQGNKQFDTETLWLHHKTGIGTTEDKVVVKNGIMHASGTGAEFKSHTSEIKLLADTFTTYESTKQKTP